MDSALLNPFVGSALNVLKVMAHVDATPGRPEIKEGNVAWGDVSGLIGLAGQGVNGNMIISFDRACILEIVSKMLMEQFLEINDEVIDAVGELTNMICGGTKQALAEQGYQISMATPIMMTGKDIRLSQLSKGPRISIPFSTAAGQFVVEANIERTK